MTRRAKVSSSRYSEHNATPWEELSGKPLSNGKAEAESSDRSPKIKKKKKRQHQNQGNSTEADTPLPGGKVTGEKTVDEPSAILKVKKKKKKAQIQAEGTEQTAVSNQPNDDVNSLVREKKKKRKKLSEEHSDGVVPKKKKLKKRHVEASDGAEENNPAVEGQQNTELDGGQKQKIVLPCSDKEIYLHKDLEEVKSFAQRLKKEGLVSAKGYGLIISKWKHRDEKRTERREQRRLTGKECFNCRQVGHLISECPQVKKSKEFEMGVCFKCGSTEHKVQVCKVRVKGFPFAQCFVCSEQGHLSRDCPENPNGVFPKGGCCRECGARDHLWRECPELKKREPEKEMVVGAWRRPDFSADAEEEEARIERKPKKKIVVMK